MIFRRRERLGWVQQATELVRPRKSWRRGFEYLGRRVQRLRDTPHRIALGCACGVMASFSPFLGLHLFVGALMAWLIGGNIIASAFGQLFGNWLTFPFIATICLKMGGLILGGPTVVEDFDAVEMISNLGYFFDRIFWPYLVGGIVPGLVCSALFYYLVRPIVAAYQSRRRNRLTERAAALLAAHAARRPRPPRANP